MWLWLRNTASRGRAGVPASFLRMRLWIRARMSSLVFMAIPRRALPRGTHAARRSPLFRAGCSRLARLLLQHLAHVADALLLVRVRLAQLADLRRHLADLLAVDPGDGDAVRLGVH